MRQISDRYLRAAKGDPIEAAAMLRRVLAGIAIPRQTSVRRVAAAALRDLRRITLATLGGRPYGPEWGKRLWRHRDAT